MNPYFVAGAVIAVALAGAGGYVKGTAHGKAEVQSAWDQERAKQAEEYAKDDEEEYAEGKYKQ